MLFNKKNDRKTSSNFISKVEKKTIKQNQKKKNFAHKQVEGKC